MSIRPRLLVLGAALTLIFLITVVYIVTREPKHQGRKLTEWLHEYAQGQRTAEERDAIRAIGLNGLPIALERIAFEPLDSPIDKAEIALLGYRRRVLAEEQAQEAVGYFIAMGPEAREAIPALTNLAISVTDEKTRQRAVSCLLAMEDYALPFVTSVLADPQHPAFRAMVQSLWVDHYQIQPADIPQVLPHLIKVGMLSDPEIAWDALMYLRELKVNPQLTRPAWTNAARSGFPNFRYLSIQHLQETGDTALIEELLSDRDPRVRARATNELESLRR